MLCHEESSIISQIAIIFVFTYSIEAFLLLDAYIKYHLIDKMQRSSAEIHNNNFDFLRLLFATFVLITHSYSLTGMPERDLLWQFSHGQTRFSYLGVTSFFAISGYLILKSLLRSQSIGDYYFKRIVRVFPALWVAIGLTLIAVYFISNKNFSAYLLDNSVHRYLLNLILRVQFTIDDVFKYNPYAFAINGSLWTIPYEFFFYIILTPLFFIRNNLKVLRTNLISVFVILLILEYSNHSHFLTYRSNLSSENLIMFGLYFSGGAILALFPEWFRVTQRRNLLVIISTVGILLLMVIGGFNILKFLLIPIFVVALGTSSYSIMSWVRKYGDISYGIYIYGFLVQQLLWHILQPSQLGMLVLSIPITGILAFASWHIIEEPALRLKLNLMRIARSVSEQETKVSNSAEAASNWCGKAVVEDGMPVVKGEVSVELISDSQSGKRATMG